MEFTHQNSSMIYANPKQVRATDICELLRNKGTPTILLVALCIEILVRTARSGQGTGCSALLSSHTVSAPSPRIKIVC